MKQELKDFNPEFIEILETAIKENWFEKKIES